jgi:pimeloyl-ACP methyl ester carboxylesterase
LEKEGHFAAAVTLTGEGDRVHLASSGVGMDTAVQDVLQAAKYAGLDTFVLVGHSFAGEFAAAVADLEPDSVQSLVYVDA